MTGRAGFGRRAPDRPSAGPAPFEADGERFQLPRPVARRSTGSMFGLVAGGFAAGIVVIMVAMNWNSIVGRFGSGPTTFVNNWRSAEGPGAMTIEQMVFTFDESALPAAYGINQPVIAMAMQQLADGEVDGAAAMLRSADTTDPVVTYAQGVVAIAAADTDTLEAQRLLRSAAVIVPQARVMLGELLFKTAFVSDQLPRGSLRMIGTDGNPAVRSVSQFLSEAVHLWETAVPLGSVKAQRLLGMATARGLVVPSDVVAAFTIWDAAATGGDHVAQFECAMLLLTGAPGIEADIDRAINYLRLAAAQNFPPAVEGLAYALTKPMLEGDEDAGREAIEMVGRALGFPLSIRERAALEDLFGHYLMEVVPPALRDPDGAVGHWMRAVEYGRWESAISIGDAYRLGNGRDVDLVRAFAYYTAAAMDIRDEGLEAQRAAIELRLSGGQYREAMDMVQDIRGPGEVRMMMDQLENTPGVRVGPLRATPGIGTFEDPSSIFGTVP